MLTMMICRWVANRISNILGSEDDVVIELCFGLIEGIRHVRVLPSTQADIGAHPILTVFPARHQGTSDSTDWFPRGEHRGIHQGPMESSAERPRQPSRCTERTFGGQEVGAHARKGKRPYSSVSR